jgi:hypothetical protein
VDGSQVADTGAVARTLASPNVLTAPQLAGAILLHFSDAEHRLQHMSVPAIAASLSATHSEGSVVLSVLWTSPAGANEILTAAVDVLQQDRVVRATLAPTTVAARLETEAPADLATRTPGEESDATATLLTKLLLGLVAAALLPYALTLIWPVGTPGTQPDSVPAVEGSRSESVTG